MTKARSLQIPIHGSPRVIDRKLGEGGAVDEAMHVQLAAFMKEAREERLKQKAEYQKQIDGMKAKNEMLQNRLL